MSALREIEEKGQDTAKERDKLLMMVADSYRRMATNPDPTYRRLQMNKCSSWLKELTQLYEKHPFEFNLHPY